MAFSEVIPLDTVLSHQLGLYQVTLSNWGNIGTGADANSIVSPRFNFPLGGIAIDPESQVDRCILRPEVNGQISTNPVLQDSDIPIGKDPLLMGRFSFPRIQGFSGGWGIVCGSSERWGDQMLDINGNASAFGGAVGLPQIFVRPSLRLILFTDAGLPIPSITRRAPQRFTNRFASFIGLGQNHRLFWLPILGRKNVRVTSLARTAGPGFLRVRGIALPDQASTLLPQEFQLAADVALNNNAAVSVQVPNPQCHFLEIVVQQDAGAVVGTMVEADD